MLFRSCDIWIFYNKLACSILCYFESFLVIVYVARKVCSFNFSEDIGEEIITSWVGLGTSLNS